MPCFIKLATPLLFLQSWLLPHRSACQQHCQFAYEMHIVNRSSEAMQLLGRTWDIRELSGGFGPFCSAMGHTNAGAPCHHHQIVLADSVGSCNRLSQLGNSTYYELCYWVPADNCNATHSVGASGVSASDLCPALQAPVAGEVAQG